MYVFIAQFAVIVTAERTLLQYPVDEVRVQVPEVKENPVVW
jgi:hypothetical protein